MHKNTKKDNRGRYIYNKGVIMQLVQKYKVSESTVRKAINGDRQSIISEDIKKDYYKAISVVENVIPVLIKDVINP